MTTIRSQAGNQLAARKPNAAPANVPARPAPSSGSGDGFAWSINLNGIGHLAQARSQLKRAHDLGVTQVRVDFAWNLVEPKPGQFNARQLTFYRDVIAEAKRQGITIVPVLSHPPAWAMALYKGGRKAQFFDSYKGFTREIATRFGDDISYYQLWNEPNTPVDPIARQDDWQLWLAGDEGIRAGDKNGHECAVNFLADQIDQPTFRQELEYEFSRLNAADPHHTVRMIGLDEYPNTWSSGGPTAYRGLDTLIQALNDPKSAVHGFDAAIMETGDTTYIPRVPFVPRFIAGVIAQIPFVQSWFAKQAVSPQAQARQEEAQADWYRQALPALTRKIKAFNRAHPGHGFKFVNLYTLSETGKPQAYSPEANFGLYRANGTAKPALQVVKDFIRQVSGQ